MKCKEILKMLGEYIDGDLDPAVCEELMRHMDQCRPCQIMVDTIKKTIRLYKNGKPCDLPSGFHDRLHDSLRASWKKSR